MRISILFLLIIALCLSCAKDEMPTSSNCPGPFGIVKSIETNKSRYHPEEEVVINVFLLCNDFESVQVAFKHLITTIEERTLSPNGNQLELTWMPPTTDFKGYSVEFKFIKDGAIVEYASTAVDVSSDWTKFPRYGFLSKFQDQSNASIEHNLNHLNTYHINGIQYYDWHNKHHIPLPMDGNSPQNSWQDIAKREIAFNTVKTYINKAKDFNMASMSYNLLYGAWEDYLEDGVAQEWMIFNDANHNIVNKHDLDNGWALSDIYVVNPANEDWQDYIFERTDTIYQHLDFDGWHLDQLGHRGDVYDYDGNPIDIWNTFPPFLNNLQQRFPDKKMVLNAVNQYGQLEILSTPVDFSYTEVWSPNDSYKDLANVVLANFNFNNSVNTVLAAYMNYDLADNPGSFNDASVLMTDAVIMAFGGAHLELGEHMLGKEYFPNDNLSMSDELKKKLVEYYDFMVANQNILRDGETIQFNPDLSSDQINITNWNPTLETVASFKKEVNDLTAYHLLNFYGLNSLEWRDNNGTQNNPDIHRDFKVVLPTNQVNKVIYTSPDYQDGVQVELDYLISGNSCAVTIPYLEYWGVLIVE